MPTMNCVCGHRMQAGTPDALFDILRAHNDEKHAELNIPDAALHGLIRAQQNMTPWDGETVTLEAPPRIVALEPKHAKDVLDFFDNDAFADNPIWASCFCYFPHHAPDFEAWNRRTGEQNRADKAALIEQGEAHAMLAFAGDKLVGWCHAAPRVTLPMFDLRPGFETDDADRVGSIVCFLVAAPYRGQGIANMLLDAACDDLRDRGLAVAESYVPKGEVSAARAHLGTEPMYRNAGFTTHRDTDRTLIMRKPLI